MTILFGAVPATGLVVLVPFLFIFGAGGFLESAFRADVTGAVIGLLLVGWALLAVWGTYGLWAAALGPSPIAATTAASLVSGIVAVVPMLFLPLKSLVTLEVLDIPLLIPVGVAAWHLWRWNGAKGQPP